MKLMDVITADLSTIKMVRLVYKGGDSIKVLSSDSDKMIINEYMDETDSKFFANVSHIANTLTVEAGARTFKSADIEVLMPAGYTAGLEISTMSGDIEINIPLRLNKLSIATVSGDISADDIEVVTGKISAQSGDLMVGDVKSQTLNCSSISGDMNLNVVKTDVLNMQTTSGDIQLRGVSASRVALNSVSGDFSMGLNELKEMLNLHAVSGDLRVSVNRAVAKDMRLEISSVSGDRNIDIPHGGKKLPAKISTVSGDITVTAF